jgi:hypothetical protein
MGEEQRWKENPWKNVSSWSEGETIGREWSGRVTDSLRRKGISVLVIIIWEWPI